LSDIGNVRSPAISNNAPNCLVPDFDGAFFRWLEGCAIERGELFWVHAFEFACAQADIDHRLTKPKQPWTNSLKERGYTTSFKELVLDVYDGARREAVAVRRGPSLIGNS
jgi:hypothetical protein